MQIGLFIFHPFFQYLLSEREIRFSLIKKQYLTHLVNIWVLHSSEKCDCELLLPVRQELGEFTGV